MYIFSVKKNSGISLPGREGGKTESCGFKTAASKHKLVGV